MSKHRGRDPQLASDLRATVAARQTENSWLRVAPGIAIAAALAAIAMTIAILARPVFPIPTMVVALILGIALNPVASARSLRPGLDLCAKWLLRWAVALLGIRITFGDIGALGWRAAAVVVIAMAATLVAGFWLARKLRLPDGFGAIAGAATAVCGASAALATFTVVPNYPGKDVDVAFVVVAVNLLSTVAMVLYPMLCVGLGFDGPAAGFVLGATIHDVAQVAGAGYAVSESTGNTAIIVKLFRVFLLLPTVLFVGWYFARKHSARTRMPVPAFAVAFVLLAVVNSTLIGLPSIAPHYVAIKTIIAELSNWGLLIAISALGLGTSFFGLASLGWRHLALVCSTTIVILAVVLLFGPISLSIF